MDSGFYFDKPVPQTRRLRRQMLQVLLGLVMLALAALSFMQSPYVIESPGPVFNVLGNSGKTPVISIPDAKTYPTDGALQLLTVSVYGTPDQTPNWGEVALAWLNPSEVVTPMADIYPPQTSSKVVDKQNQAMMTDSQSQATAVALNALGYRYTSQVYVSAIAGIAKTGDHLKVNDIVEKVNGKAISGYDDLHKLVEGAQGKALNVEVLRGGKPLLLHVNPVKVKNTWRLGIYIGGKFKFPINVKLSLSDVGGPSGGMMFALGIYDKLTPGALTRGQIIAGTGTIDAAGAVGPIGGIRQKMYGAVRGGARWFLAPQDNCNEVVGHIPAGLQVVKVATFTDALAAVKQIAARKSVAGLASCTK